MSAEFKRPASVAGGASLIFALLAGLLLWLLPGPHERFSYLVAGTFATTAALAVVFVFLARNGLLSASDRNNPE